MKTRAAMLRQRIVIRTTTIQKWSARPSAEYMTRLKEKPDLIQSGNHRPASEVRGNSLVELRIKANSEVTWMKAASDGFKYPKTDIPTPMQSTTRVPTKFCVMMARQRRATRNVSTNFERSLPMRMTSALSLATSVPDPIAMPTFASTRAGASLMPSPMSRFLPAFKLRSSHVP
jgi:hypothetical protein